MNFLEFANPGAWSWALLAVPIALLYILKIRLRRQPVSTLLFWDQLFDEKKPRAWWQRLRHLLSLLLQLAFLLLLVAALADPLWSWQQQRQRRMVLIVDNSASMQATESDGPTRLDQAKRSAAALVRSMRGGDRMAILSAGGRPHVAIGMTDHQRSLVSAIDAIPATDGPTDVVAAVAVAERLLAGQEGEAEVIVLSDCCFDEVQQLLSSSTVTLYGVGRACDNVGITRYQVRRSLLDAVGYQVLVDVANFSEVGRSCRVEFNLEGELVDVIPIELAAGEAATRIVDHTSLRGGRLIATLDVDDALAIDNRAIAVLPTRKPLPVVLVSKGNLFLKSVLEAIPLVDLRIVTEPPPAAPSDGILVLDRTVPPKLPRGRVFVVDPLSSCDLWAMGAPIPQPIVASVDDDSPLTQHVRLDNVLFPDARRLEFTADHQPLIQDPLDQSLLARLPRADGDVVVLTCSLEKGDLPLRIAFPVLMKNAIEWFQGHSGELRPAVCSGTMVSITLPASGAADTATPAGTAADAAGVANEPPDDDAVKVEQADNEVVRNLVLVSPSQETLPIAVSDRQATIGPLLETGLWTVRPEGDADVRRADRAADHSSAATLENPSTVRVACNLANASESDLRPRAKVTDVGSLHQLGLGGRSLWFYLTLVAAALIATEWWLYQRRIVG